MKRLYELRIIACCAIGLIAPVVGCVTPPTFGGSTNTPAKASTAAAATVAFVAVRSPVTRGSTGEVTLRTAPGATCSIIVAYSSGSATSRWLATKIADGNGLVTWSWTVSTEATPGAWPIDVKCDDASAQAMFRIQ